MNAPVYQVLGGRGHLPTLTRIGERDFSLKILPMPVGHEKKEGQSPYKQTDSYKHIPELWSSQVASRKPSVIILDHKVATQAICHYQEEVSSARKELKAQLEGNFYSQSI